MSSSVGPTSSSLYRAVWRWHFFAALIVIPFVLWQSVTGTLYLWSEWWMDRIHPQLRFVEPSDRRAPVALQIAAALATVSGGSDANRASRAATVHREAPIHHASRTPSASAAEHGVPVQCILISADPARSTVVLFQSANGLPFPVFVDPHDARVQGTLSGVAWLPGITRSLHGGWPLGDAGSWLLELGAGWAIVMILTGLYLWWPRGRGFLAGLWPRLHAGARVALRDLHSCVAVWFSLVFLFFLVSALPWTSFWGGEILTRIESTLSHQSPAGFSPGGASVSQMSAALPSVQAIVTEARAREVGGTLDIRLAPWAGAPLFVTNPHSWPAEDRTILGDPGTGAVAGDFRNTDLPAIPRFVALGIHLHQGDFGVVNVWLNTAFALSLIWLTVTGVSSWWYRRPERSLGVPPKVLVRWPRPVKAAGMLLCLMLPLLGASVLIVLLIDSLLGRWMANNRKTAAA